MTQTQTQAEAGAVEAVIPYVVAGESAVFYPGERDKSYWPVEEHRMVVRDARAAKPDFERNGFVLLERPSQCRDLLDPDEVKRVYYPEIEAIVKSLTGAFRVLMFGDVARTDAPEAAQGRLPSRGAHVDYEESTVRMFTQRHAPDEADELLKHRFMLINLWRPIRTVERTPLALCDASTVEASDLNPSEVRGGLMDSNSPVMRGFNLSYNPRHRWYYAPRMRPEEILAFKLFDSETSAVQWTGHTAFDDPTSAPDAPPRQSLEIRTISFV